jgi:inhibitor of KinA
MEIVPVGDSALIVRLCERFDNAPEKTMDKVLRTFRQIQDAGIPGLIELAPAYTSVTVFFDPMVVAKAAKPQDTVFDWFAARIRASVAEVADSSGKTGSAARTVEIPVSYDSEFAFDLNHVAQTAGISPADVIDLHSSAEYRVACIGFVPGFPFLTGLPRKLATPRRDVPRKEIPPGSVGIGGAQTGIYPLRSPGGWNLIGRTPLRLFDPVGNPPVLLRAGECVRFRKITRDEFELFER